MKKWIALMLALIAALSLMTGCRTKTLETDENTTTRGALLSQADAPALPDTLDYGEDGVPTIIVYDVAERDYKRLNIEDYVMGVLAGEMRNDWPMEALKAQAILARTFVLKFISEKQSKYDGADISTDISEAQAYAPDQINERIEKAVSETRGQVLSAGGELPYAWFHAHSGGKTELPVEGLDYDQENPSYLRVVESPDSDSAPTTVKNWSATFTANQVARAAKEAGVDVGSTVTSIEAGKKSESGRTIYFLINGRRVSAPALRLQLDSTVLKSTLISSVELKDGRVTFTGSGYGHGVGMSQWGAYALALDGRTAEEIISWYFTGVGVVTVW
ncbi:MAG: SpoIID/LytB domain-containing protein [Clostridiales bacterium]|nr:SpoIID/LytB domain-containing protein [Clostridiales bacterium]